MLIFVRHGATEENISGKLLGLTDPAILEIGQQQAAALGNEILGKYDISHVFSSTLRRAKSTAKVLCGLFETNPIMDERLVERDFGPYEGLSRLDLEKMRLKNGLCSKDPTQNWSWDLRLEQDAEVFTRFLSFSRSHNIFELSHTNDILIVSHANFIKCVVYNLLSVGLTIPKAFKITEASYLAFHVEPPSIFELRELWQNPLKKTAIK